MPVQEPFTNFDDLDLFLGNSHGFLGFLGSPDSLDSSCFDHTHNPSVVDFGPGRSPAVLQILGSGLLFDQLPILQ